MPYYYRLKDFPQQQKLRAVRGLRRLRNQLDDEMPGKTRSETLVVGTWNIRNFDDNRFGYGRRSSEDLHYIAEIISRFDIIAVQEVCRDLWPLDQVMRILGDRDYEYIVSDPTEGRAGNDERLGFIYDKHKVWFQGVAGEIVLPPKLELSVVTGKRQFSRSPFMCSFQAGWFKFMMSTVHIYFGSNSGQKYEQRVAEIAKVAKFLSDRAEDDPRNHILVGDFNIKKGDSKGANALRDNGFEIFLNRDGSNKNQTKFYDQISFLERDGEVRLVRQGAHGVFQFFDSIFRPQDVEDFRPELTEVIQEKIQDQQDKKAKALAQRDRGSSQSSIENAQKKIDKADAAIAEYNGLLSGAGADDRLADFYLNEWRTFHASDHLPLWVELEIDFSEDYLSRLEHED